MKKIGILSCGEVEDPTFAGEHYYVVADTRRIEDQEIVHGRETVAVQRQGVIAYIDLGVLEPCEVVVLDKHFIAKEA